MRPSVTPSQPWNFPTPEILHHTSGLELWWFDLPGQFVAACDLVMPVSLAREPREVEGVGTIALTAIDEGTRTNPSGRITELLELQGAAVSGAAHQNYTRISLDAPVYRLPATLPLLAEVITQPDYDPDDITRHIEWQVAAFETRLVSPGALARMAMRSAMFGEQVREGRPTAGTPETLGNITAEAVRDWHTHNFSPDGATLIVAGDLSGLSPTEVLSNFDTWTGGPPATWQQAKPTHARTVLIDMPDAVQATIHLATITIGRYAPDWSALKLATHAIAGAFSSRLNLELRERRGLTYGISGVLNPRRRDGWFGISGNYRVENAVEALQIILEAVELDEPFTDREIEDVRNYLIGVGPLANETAVNVAHQAAVLAAASISTDYVDRHLRALAIPTAADATSAFRRNISPAGLTVVIAGPAQQLIPALEAAGISAEVL